jgi:phosphatidylserine decarboxylase
MQITYVDRVSGKTCEEKVYGQMALSLLYGESLFSRLLSPLFLPLLTYIPLFSFLYGWLQKQPFSAKKVNPFIQRYGVDMSDFAPQEVRSFNDFFIRKLKPEARALIQDPNICLMPADGRYLAYPAFSRFSIKGQSFSLDEFVQDPVLANRYREGSLLIARLCPTDYHRFHFPCDAHPISSKPVHGPLFSVNPLALAKRPSIFAENKRVLTELHTERFGKILYVEIGATFVGSIHQTFAADHPVKKGEEKGYFEFGGSCLALLFEKGAITFDADLIANTEKGLETKASFGQSMGRSTCRTG